jgi:translation initiation factor 2D
MLIDAVPYIQKNGMKGKCLQILHFYQDFLWFVYLQYLLTSLRQHGSKEEPPFPSAEDSSEEEKEPNPTNENAETTTQDVTVEATNDQPKEQTEEQKDEQSQAKDETQEQKEEPPAEVDHDALVNYCFMAAIKTIKEKELPILANLFWSKYMLAARPPDTTVDIKHSSYKKVRFHSDILTRIS